MEAVIEEEIENLVGKLGELKRRTRVKESEGGRSCNNIDKQVVVLQRRLEKLGGIGISEDKKEIRDFGRRSLSANVLCEGDDDDYSNCRVSSFPHSMFP